MINIILTLIVTIVSIYSLISVIGLKKEIRSKDFKLSIAKELPELVTEKYKEVFDIDHLAVDDLKETDYTITLPKRRLEKIAESSIQWSKELAECHQKIDMCNKEIEIRNKEIDELKLLVKSQNEEINSLKDEIKYLRRENAELKERLNNIENGAIGKTFLGKFGFNN